MSRSSVAPPPSRWLLPLLVSCSLVTGTLHAADPGRCAVPASTRSSPVTDDAPCRRADADLAGATTADLATLLPSPDRAGLRSDTRRFLGLQLAALAVLYAAPEGVSGWSEEQIDAAGFDRWWKNIGKFEWDRDVWWINYALHPYWGAAYYTRARERGFSRSHAFGYSVLLSTEYELVAEAFFENPSLQDLIATPLLGSLLAHGIEPWRRRVRERHGRPTRLERTGLVLSDPLGAINRQIDRLAARSSGTLRASVAAVRSRPPARASGLAFDDDGPPTVPGDAGARGWGLELRLTW